jgi:hypothetical protein
MAGLLVRVRDISHVSDVIIRRFEKVRNSHEFENLTKRHRSEVQMSVT